MCAQRVRPLSNQTGVMTRVLEGNPPAGALTRPVRRRPASQQNPGVARRPAGRHPTTQPSHVRSGHGDGQQRFPSAPDTPTTSKGFRGHRQRQGQKTENKVIRASSHLFLRVRIITLVLHHMYITLRSHSALQYIRVFVQCIITSESYRGREVVLSSRETRTHLRVRQPHAEDQEH